ncbi:MULTISPECIES: N-acetyltransferase [Rhizobium]|uniref:N-acetyltransferase n=1 Tax=Rhizobium TaxID=379 RepID=UPI001C83D325|nr:MULTISPECIES: N-acetyltransferase [Rhizobium]MBX4893752.1 N-acetyltransferase [Rhizobium bangladeshense]MBX5014402.1 N-acetyltransferase [Rhizobium lentis]
MQVRISASEDIHAMVELAENRRYQYQVYQPVFWRKAENSADVTREFFDKLIAQQGWHCFTALEGAELRGFLIARETAAPPVYAPGGATITVDDFCVRDPSDWPTVGKALVDKLKATAEENGWGQLVIVCGDKDLPKKEMLNDAGLTVASNWFTVPISPRT